MRRSTYSRWDGTQVGFEYGADDAFRDLTDEVLYHGDLNQALQRLLQRGFRDRNGRHVAGLRELLEQLRQRRQELLEDHDVSGPYEDIARRLGDILDDERASLDEERDVERSLQLELLPQDLAGRLRELQSYDWANPDAGRRFDELVDELRSELLSSHFNRMRDAMSDVSPGALQRTKDMMNDLNRMLEAREAGRDTDRMFEEFMERYGDMFPDNPSNLDELLESLARQMAAMSQLLASMTPEQRRELQALSDALLEDMDLRWQMDRLGANLRGAFPQMGWDRARPFQGGGDALGLGQAASLMNELGDLDQLEQLMARANHPAALAEIDTERAAELLGDASARALEQLARLSRQLQDAGLVEHREGRLELTPRGLRAIGRNALADLFSRLVKDRMGRHGVDALGLGHERTYETKAYEWGDPFNLSIERTVRNAIGRAGAGTPVRLSPDDFEVERTETLTRTSTVLLLDLSLSMEFRGNFLAAKKVAMAMHALITSQYPTDYLGLVGFGERAQELKAAQLPEVSWDFSYGTNMHHALLLARQMLARQRGTKQVIMITDGEPTAHLLASGDVFFNYPPVRETIDQTVAEVMRATRDGITINTFVLDATPDLRRFVERLSEINRGRVFFTTPDTLGDYVLVDFLDQK
ncbi:MAG: vWA domain-containing protein, partial [Acidimicrobiales bacterium]